MFCISDVESDIRQAAKIANEGEEINKIDALTESLCEREGGGERERERKKEREGERESE